LYNPIVITLTCTQRLCLCFIIIFSPSAVTKTKQQDSFYFDPPPVSQDVIEGEDMKLRCDVSNRKMIIFYWTLNGKQLTNTSRRYQDGSDLRILRVDRVQDAGSLRCIATNVTTGIALRSTEAKLNILCKSRYKFAVVVFACFLNYLFTTLLCPPPCLLLSVYFCPRKFLHPPLPPPRRR